MKGELYMYGIIDKYGSIESVDYIRYTDYYRYTITYTTNLYDIYDRSYLQRQLILKSNYFLPTFRTAFELYNDPQIKNILGKYPEIFLSDYPINNDLDIEDFCNTFNITEKETIREIKKIVIRYQLQ